MLQPFVPGAPTKLKMLLLSATRERKQPSGMNWFFHRRRSPDSSFGDLNLLDGPVKSVPPAKELPVVLKLCRRV